MANPPPFDLGLGLENTHVLITGGCGLIGSVVVKAFLAAGANVTIADLHPELPPAQQTSLSQTHSSSTFHYQTTDIRSAESIDKTFTAAEKRFGPVECCLAIASLDLSSLPQTESICDADPAVWQTVFHTNIHGTFLTAQRWLRGIRSSVRSESHALKNVNLILMGSESGKFGVRTCAAYAAGKAAVQYGLLDSLAMDVPRVWIRARVNAVAPGAVETRRFGEEKERYGRKWEWGECEATVGMAKPVPIEDVTRTFLFLASERWSGSTHGQVLHVDGGKMGSLVWDDGEAQGKRREQGLV